ncbi:MAG: carboxypeptidase-like regulatory domain-containing protein [Muribaculaceae bacterium]|nr:carboxypeptidase-like regulatory domain-containing protein [Muribaculaceae bacterium]
MHLLKFIIPALFVLAAQSVEAQSPIAGTVLDEETLEPVVGATITDANQGKVLTVTQADGTFTIPKNNEVKLKISSIGYKTLITKPTTNGRYLLKTEVSQLGEVVVTAQENRGLTTSSRIEKHAMEHLQPSSFTDILELLPGGRSIDPSLDAPNTIHIREISTGNSNYATSSLGTSFIVDGAPISTNANMQYIAGAWDDVATKRDNTNSGVDMRAISTDDIERVEIVRGIPSVEYGDLTSGLVKIERLRGGHDIKFRLKADMGSKLFYAAKDFEWEPRRLTLNLSADYLDAKADPRNSYENYKRLSISARMQKKWEKEDYGITFSSNLDFTKSLDNDKEDIDQTYSAEDSYKSSYDRFSLLSAVQLKMKQSSWFKSVDLSLSASLENDLIERTRLVQLSRMTIAPMSKEEGENDAIILPFKYTGHHKVEGKPLNVYAKLNARLQIPSNSISNSLLVGADWNLDKNLGRGQVFDPMKPVYTGISSRQRSLKDIPANHRLSAYAEESMKWPTVIGSLEVAAGIRATTILNLNDAYTMNGKIYWDPRLNIGYSLPQMTWFGKPAFIRIAAGIGQHTKMPTMEQLFPDLLYVDFIQLNYYHDNPDYRRINLMTYIVNPRNTALEPARNLKKEITLDINVGGNRLSITAFREKMTSGFRTQSHYQAYQYKQYDASGINAATLTAPPSLDNLPYTIVNELAGYGNYTNGSMTLKEGIEYTLETKRFPVILTRLTINGAYLRTTYNNSIVDSYRPSQVIDNRQIQYVGLYANDDGSVRQSFNTNFTIDTDIPRLKLGFSISAQCLWFTTSQRKEVSNYPVQYIAPDGTVHPWQDSDANDLYLRWLVRDYSPSQFEKNRVPFAMNVNLKVTKKLFGDRLHIAMFCNKLLDYTPDYDSRGTTIRRHVTPYFGLEMNIKL